jgi:hypothetical protein
MYSYEPFKEYQRKKTILDAEETFACKLNTKESIATYKYFGSSGPITKRQKEKYKALPILRWKYLGNTANRGYKMDKATHVLLVVALTIGVIVGGIYISRTVSVDCWNFFGFAKGCAASTAK